VGCGGDEATQGSTDPGAVSATVSNGVVSVPVSIEGTMTMPFLVDTGSVITRLDPTRFTALGISPGLAQVTTLDVGAGVHLTDVQVVAASLCGVGMMCPTTAPAGLLGGAVLEGFAVTIDYHRSSVVFGTFTPPSGVGAPVMAPFTLEGGSSATVGDTQVTVPATRIALDVDIEGMVVPMLVDTGSSTMVLVPALYDALVADGRAQSTTMLATVTGNQSVSTTTLHTVSLAGAAQSNIAAVRSPFDMTLLSSDVGHPVQGLVGGAYLQHYITTIDYPARVITLRPN
jgi:predicted aspartyl protease